MTSSETSIRFAIVDVFADEPLSGNPLAVVPDADDLGDDQMRRIAREFNQSETTFLVRPTRQGADHRLRSFTAAGVEVLGAGHNALGAWLWLAQSGDLSPRTTGRWSQQIGGDVLPLEISDLGGRYLVTMEQASARYGSVPDDLDRLAAALGLEATDLHPTLPTLVAGTGADHLLVAACSPAVVDRAVVDAAALREVLARAGGEGCYLYALSDDPNIDAYARFFNPTVGIVEDPATGTAAGPLAAALTRDRGADAAHLTVLQGHVMGRPSRLSVTVEAGRVRLSGSGLIVASGALHL